MSVRITSKAVLPAFFKKTKSNKKVFPTCCLYLKKNDYEITSTSTLARFFIYRNFEQ